MDRVNDALNNLRINAEFKTIRLGRYVVFI